MRWNFFTMTKGSIISFLLIISLLLFARVQGFLWMAAGALLLGGLVFSLRCYTNSRPVLGAVLWTVSLSSALFLLGLYLPDVRFWELLYI